MFLQQLVLLFQDDGELSQVRDDGWGRCDGITATVRQPLLAHHVPVAVQLTVPAVQLPPVQSAALLHGSGRRGQHGTRVASPTGRHELALPTAPSGRPDQAVSRAAAEASQGAAHPTPYERLHGLGQGGAQEAGRREPRPPQRRSQQDVR